MGDPCRSSDIRELLDDSNMSDVSGIESGDGDVLGETAVNLLSSDLENEDLGLVDINNLTDFSSGSNDNYSPHLSEAESSDMEVGGGDNLRPRPTLLRPTTDCSDTDASTQNETVPGSSQTNRTDWVPVHPPEEEMNAEAKFKVRNPGIKNCPTKNSLPIAYFNLFFTQAIWSLIVRETNAYAAKVFSFRRDSGTLKEKSRIKRWVDVTIPEMKRFIAIVINMGMTVRKNIKDYWSTLDCDYIPWYGKTMSCNRFVLISSVFHLNSADSVGRGQPGYDPWHKVRKFLDSINHSFKQYYTPTQNISIDETMIGMKNRVIFIQYMPKKRHARFGIKKFEVCESDTGYVLHTALYSGKDFLQGGSDPFTQKVVIDLMSQTNLLDKYYHLFTDNFYTKLPLAETLNNRKTFLTGTVNKNTKGLCKNVMQAKLGPTESIYYRKGPILLVGYKQKKNRKPVYLITTGCHAQNEVIRSRKGQQVLKPTLIHKYNLFMGGVDLKDKSIYHVTCTKPTVRYWKKCFFNLLDMALFNAYILYSKNTDKPLSRKNFMKQIVMDLTKEPVVAAPQIPQHPQPTNEDKHELTHLPGRATRVCPVCGKRSSWFCPGCNCGSHPKCFSKLKHFWRPLKGLKRAQPQQTSSESD